MQCGETNVTFGGDFQKLQTVKNHVIFTRCNFDKKMGRFLIQKIINDDGFLKWFPVLKVSRKTFTRGDAFLKRRNIICVLWYSKALFESFFFILFCFKRALLDFEVKRPFCCFYVTLIFSWIFFSLTSIKRSNRVFDQSWSEVFFIFITDQERRHFLTRLVRCWEGRTSKYGRTLWQESIFVH